MREVPSYVILKAKIMDEAAVRRAIVRISHEILEKNNGADNTCILGILRRGKPLAEMIRDNIKNIEHVNIPCGELDINYYRDDLSRVHDNPVVRNVTLPFDIADKRVIIVDDVLYTGRTVRAAIEAVFSLGRPAGIQLAILVDRGHRELPIRADFVGKNIPTAKSETVKVYIPPYDGETGVSLFE